MKLDPRDLDNWFSYHPPNKDQNIRYDALRSAGRRLAEQILMCTPLCEEQSAAILKVREAVMLANSAIACNE